MLATLEKTAGLPAPRPRYWFMADAVLAVMMRCTDAINKAASDVIGMEGEAAAVLLMLSKDAQTVTECANRAALTHSATVRVIAKLERAGFVTKARSAEDNREVISFITKSGLRAAEKIRTARDKEVKRVIHALGITGLEHGLLPEEASPAWRML